MFVEARKVGGRKRSGRWTKERREEAKQHGRETPMIAIVGTWWRAQA